MCANGVHSSMCANGVGHIDLTVNDILRPASCVRKTHTEKKNLFFSKKKNDILRPASCVRKNCNTHVLCSISVLTTTKLN